MNLRSALGRARGLGSAKAGLSHWWAQRLTAVGLVPLSLWLAISLAGLAGADYDTFSNWLSAPGNAALMLLTVLMIVHHAQLGLQVVIEDYVHDETAKFAGLIATKLIAAFLAAFLAVSTLKVALGG